MNRVATATVATGGAPRPLWLSFWFALLLLALIVSGIGAAVYLSARRSALQLAYDNLESVARLKEAQVNHWMFDAHHSAKLALGQPLLAREFTRWIEAGRPASPARAFVRAHLDATMATGQFRAVGIHSTADGSSLLATAAARPDSPQGRRMALRAASEQHPVLDDFHAGDGSHPGTSVGFYCPIASAATNQPLFVAHLELDPGVHLLPLLSQWPVSSPSAETLLFRVEGDEIVFLSQARHGAEESLNLRRPLAAPALLASQVAKGRIGAVSGVDYRDVPSIGYAVPVARTPWYLIAKVDEAEALAALNRTALATAAALACLLGLLAWWKVERGRHLEGRLAQRKEHEAALLQSEERFRLTFDHAPIGMLMLALDGRMVAVNAICCQLLGYSHSELLTMTVLDTTYPDDRAEDEKCLVKLRGGDTDHCSIEKRVVHKDGRILHVSVSRSLVRDGDERPLHIVCQIRDVTETKAAAARIERLSQFKAALSETNHALLHGTFPQQMFEAVCRACVDRGGFRLAWIGVIDAQSQRIVPVTTCGPAAGYVDGLVISTDPSVPEGQGPSSAVARGRRRYYCNDFTSDPIFVPWRERAAHHGLASSIALVLTRAGRPYGILSAYGAEKNFFDDEAVELLDAMADNVSFALNRFEREAQRRQSEEELRLAEAKTRGFAMKLEDLYQNAPCGYHSIDGDGVIRRINDTELGWLGYTREEVVDRLSIRDLMAVPSRVQFDQRFAAFKRDGEVHDLQVVMLRKDGSALPVLISATALYDRNGGFVASRSMVRDVSRLVELERERVRQAKHVKQLSHHLVAVQEEERRRLAAELHDRAAPNLAAVKLTLHTLMQALPESVAGEAAVCVDDARALVDDTIAGVYQVCADLRPPVLDYAGLTAALVGYTQQYTRRTGIAVTLCVPQAGRRFGAETESTLFRIVQEALANVARHATAANVGIVLESAESRTVLTVKDDGIGFDTKAIDPASPGLRAMRERAEFAGGVFELASSPGKGTEIRVELAAADDIGDSPWHRLSPDASRTVQ